MSEVKALEQAIAYVRQWLNEDRITDINKLVTNEELSHWFNTVRAHIARLEREAEAGRVLADEVKEHISSYCKSGCGCTPGFAGHDGQCVYTFPTVEEMQHWCLEDIAAYRTATQDLTSKEE